MADTEFVLSSDRMGRFIETKLSECIIAQNGDLAVSLKPDSDFLKQLNLQFRQIFIKHSSFATDNFSFKPHEYSDGSRIFIVDQFAGSGHLKILTRPLSVLCDTVFRVTVSYQSFFVCGDAHISPSTGLKKFYSSTVASAKKGTQRLELWPGRSMWFEQVLLNSHTDIVEIVRASFRRS
ncbi:hypothetical protein GOZ78_10005 [Agrobacterium vitis]|uniref:Uncharacterized protein n=1 Tax=Agrobacterium vitis TaxID=373 RepID=A0ABD6G9H2_AGRVI|nr:hypothetical protein [Agrobacterium vitis]MUO78373.1 hypothetical protein [Agrobacterium vitis]MUO94250.1 hypothetical protein [Agrobacterium vitis]MUP03296.1 hypothetical protein [Agrobacterium vitis]MUZ84410.1 hypothetical protein [Agrobacterium vitis]MVA10365.1 hypothetical protein [Agrobacterium vitis]